MWAMRYQEILLQEPKRPLFFWENKAPSISQISREMTAEKESKQPEMLQSASAENAFDLITHLEKELEDSVKLTNKIRTELAI